MKRVYGNEADGTSLIGYLDISYSDLISVFGEPGINDGYKTDAEWDMVINEEVITIYNYKSGKNYASNNPEVEDIRDWHVGGKSLKALEYLRDFLISACITFNSEKS